MFTALGGTITATARSRARRTPGCAGRSTRSASGSRDEIVPGPVAGSAARSRRWPRNAGFAAMTARQCPQRPDRRGVMPSSRPLVERDPEWAGGARCWFNVNDLTAMGAAAVGLLDAVGAPTQSLLTRVIRGIAKAVGSMAGTGARRPIPSSACPRRWPSLHWAARLIRCRRVAGTEGDAVRLAADLAGGWRWGYHGRQWDFVQHAAPRRPGPARRSGRRSAAARCQGCQHGRYRRTTGHVAEASGTGAELDVAAIPRPRGADMGSWMTCLPRVRHAHHRPPRRPGARAAKGCRHSRLRAAHRRTRGAAAVGPTASPRPYSARR